MTECRSQRILALVHYLNKLCADNMQEKANKNIKVSLIVMMITFCPLVSMETILTADRLMIITLTLLTNNSCAFRHIHCTDKIRPK